MEDITYTGHLLSNNGSLICQLCHTPCQTNCNFLQRWMTQIILLRKTPVDKCKCEEGAPLRRWLLPQTDNKNNERPTSCPVSMGCWIQTYWFTVSHFGRFFFSAYTSMYTIHLIAQWVYFTCVMSKLWSCLRWHIQHLTLTDTLAAAFNKHLQLIKHLTTS